MGTSEARCPLDGCSYSGEPGSVEAHITGSTDGDHQGRTGIEFRDRLRQGVEMGVDEDPLPGVDGVEVEDASGATWGSDGVENPSEGEGSSDVDEGSEADDRDGRDVGVEPVDDVDQEESDDREGAGIPIPVSSTALFAIVGLFLLAALLYADTAGSTGGGSSRGGGSSESDAAEQITGGLIG